jgi:hypothetical protein
MNAEEAPYKRYMREMTPEKGYAAGYKSGLNWSRNYKTKPGGPWICRDYSIGRDDEWTAYCELTAEVNRQWLLGWEAGRAAQNRR